MHSLEVLRPAVVKRLCTPGLKPILQKNEHVKGEIEKALHKMKELENSCSKTNFLFYLGKALNVMSENGAECEEHLSKTVKRDPSRIEAWNMLGKKATFQLRETASKVL